MIREKGWLFALGCIPLIVGLLVTLPSYAQDPEVSALVDQAWQLRKAGQLANALAVAERAVTVAEQRLGAEHVEVASALQILADLLADQHRRHDAEVAYFRALAIYERTGHQSGALVLLSLARLREAEGQLAEAEKLHRRALALQEKLGGPDHLMIPAFAGALAELLTRTGAYKEAEALSRRAIAISERSFGPEHDFTARHLNDLALVLKLTNRREEAEAIYVRALGIYEFRLGPDHLSVATTLNNLGTLYLDMGRFAEAESLLSRSLAIREKGGVASPGVTVALSNLAEVLHKANRLLDAEPLYRRALSIDEKLSGAEHPDVARDAHNLATLLLSITATLNQNRTAEAEMLFQRAQSIYEKALGPKHPTIAKIENNRAVLLALREEWTEALKHFRRATDIVTRQSASAFSRLMLLGNQTGFLLHALAAYKAAKTDVEARDEAFVAAQWAVQHTTAASLSQMSARLAAGGGRLVEPIRKQQDLMRERSEVDSRLLSAIGRTDVALVQQLNSALAEIERKLDEIERQLSKDFPEYTALANPIPLRLTEVQDLLSNDEGLIVWVQGYNVSISWVITKTQIRWVQIPLGSKQIADRVAGLRCGLDYAAWEGEGASRCSRLTNVQFGTSEINAGKPLPFDLFLAHELYQALFGQFEDVIRDKSLLIVPSGALTALPLQVLVTVGQSAAFPADITDYAKAAWLPKTHATTVLPSVPSLKALRRIGKSKATGPFIGFGNPLLWGPDGNDRRAWERNSCKTSPVHVQVASRGVRSNIPKFFRGGLANVEEVRAQYPLPETADELCAVAQSSGAGEDAVYLGEKASESTIKALSADGTLGRARVVHFATHGLLSGETEMFAAAKAEPALILSPPKTSSEEDDGLLTASEIAQLKLDADWVVLSACNTAAGESDRPGTEALSGLARAFFYAGSRALLVSHWAVNSDATVKLITKAFDELKASPKIGRAEALRRSMLDLMTTSDQNAHPANWAPFVVVGEGAQ